MVFPTSSLDAPTKITFPAYTATLQVGTTTTTVVAIPSQQTITVTVVSYFNYYITTSQQTGVPFTLWPSFTQDPVTVVVTGPDSKTTSRTIEPPPLGVPDQPGTGNPGNGTGGDDNNNQTWGWWYPKPDVEYTDDPPIELSEGDFPPLPDDPSDSGPPGPPFPGGTIAPVLDVDVPVPPGSQRRGCKIFFFFSCPHSVKFNFKVDFWDFTFPPGIIGP